MTDRALRLALLTLLAAACSPNVEQYAPKTDVDCGAYDDPGSGLRACGYRCVPQGDPATGCWELEGVCTPCSTPTGAHTVAACTTATSWWPICGSACAAGWGDCDGAGDGGDANGCETDLSASADNCGACGRACAFCADGLCPASQVGEDLPFEPVDIAQAGGQIFVIDQGDNGAFYQVGSPHGDPVVNLGTVRRVRMASATQAWVSGTEDVYPDTYGTLWKIDTLTATSWDSVYGGTVVDFDFIRVGGVIDRVAWIPSTVTGYWTVDAGNYLATGSTDTGTLLTAIAGDPTGWWEVYAGTTEGYLYGYGLGNTFGWSGFAEPSRIAVFDDGVGSTLVFSASTVDGSVSVWSGSDYIDGVLAGFGPTSAMDIHADADGVYWCDADAGVVTEWRASDGAVFDVAVGGWPVAVTSDGTRVIWADAWDSRVKSAPK